MTSEGVVREGLRHLVGDVVESAWDYLVEERAVEAVSEGDEDINWLAQKYRRLLAISSHSALTSRPAPRMLERTDPAPGETRQARSTTELRLETLSRLVAWEVVRDKQVATFREEILKGRLLEPDAVEQWIKQQAEADGPATLMLHEVPVPPTSRVTWTGHSYVIEPPLSASPASHLSNVYLYYGLPGDSALRMWTITIGGVLDRLRVLCNRLADWYGWESGQATLFVLTGGVPLVLVAEAPLRYRRLPALTRLVLTVDPVLTPREVAELYRRARAKTLSKRYRSLSEKHIQLAAFGAKAEEKSAHERMRAWNAEHPQWRYTESSNFSRDCARARKRMLYPPLANDPYAAALRSE